MPAHDQRATSPVGHALVWAVAGVVACVAVPHLLSLDLQGLRRPELLVLLALAALASVNHIEVVPARRGRSFQERHALEEASVVLLLLLLPPGQAWLVSLVGYAIGAVLRRMSPVKLVFNVGQWAVSLGVAAVVFDVLAPDSAPTMALGTVVAVTGAITVHGAINYLSVGAVVCAATEVTWRDRLHATVRLWARGLVGNLLLGLAAAALWLHSPWLIVVAFGLVAVLKDAYWALVETDERADEIRIDRDRLDLIISEATAGIILLDHDGRVTVWNTAVERMTGVPADDALGRRVGTAVGQQLRRPDGSPVDMHALAADGGEHALELSLRHRSGEERIVAVSRRAMRDRVGHVVGVVVQLQDLTAEREAARLKDDFLARVTHELRTPLTAIVGFGRTLLHRGDDLPPATRDQLRRSLVDAGEEMERLVDNLLLVATRSNQESGRSPRNFEDLPLAAYVDRAVELELADHVGCRADIRRLSDAHAVIDPDWLTTVVRHLVCNALTYSDDDSPVIVEIDTVDDQAVVRVIDRGRGIPPSKLHRVFDRFVRVEDPLKMETRGAGLGLFIVDRLVARMGGHVDVTSVLGEGSTFELRLPITAPDRPPLDVPAAAHR